MNGNCSSGCSSVPRLSSHPLSSSLGLATSSSPPGVPSLHCPNMESYKGKQVRNKFLHYENTSYSEKEDIGCGFALHNSVCVRCRTQLQKGRWTRRETVEGYPRSLSHTDQPMGVLGRTGCLCCLPSHHLSPLQIVGKKGFIHKASNQEYTL